MNVEEQIQEIEVTINDLKEMMDIGDSVIRLTQNPDWQRVIDKAYKKDEAERLTLYLGSDISPEEQAKTVSSLKSIGEFFQFLRVMVMRANQAESALKEHQETLNQVEAEGEDDEHQF